MNAIWKFPLAISDRVTVEMPRGAKCFCVQMQSGVCCLWAIVDPGQPKVAREFAIQGTGHTFKYDADTMRYVGTVQQFDGALVWHVFEIATL